MKSSDNQIRLYCIIVNLKLEIINFQLPRVLANKKPKTHWGISPNFTIFVLTISSPAMEIRYAYLVDFTPTNSLNWLFAILLRLDSFEKNTGGGITYPEHLTYHFYRIAHR